MYTSCIPVRVGAQGFVAAEAGHSGRKWAGFVALEWPREPQVGRRERRSAVRGAGKRRVAVSVAHSSQQPHLAHRRQHSEQPEEEVVLAARLGITNFAKCWPTGPEGGRVRI